MQSPIKVHRKSMLYDTIVNKTTWITYSKSKVQKKDVKVILESYKKNKYLKIVFIKKKWPFMH